jgi:hypothetical protein
MVFTKNHLSDLRLRFGFESITWNKLSFIILKPAFCYLTSVFCRILFKYIYIHI